MAQNYYILTNIQSSYTLASFIKDKLYDAGWTYYGQIFQYYYMFSLPSPLTNYVEGLLVRGTPDTLSVILAHDVRGSGEDTTYVSINSSSVTIYTGSIAYLTVDSNYFSVVVFRPVSGTYAFVGSITAVLVNFYGNMKLTFTTQDVSTGSNVVIPVQSTSGIVVGETLVALKTGGYSTVTVNEVGESYIKVNYLYTNLPSGSTIIRDYPSAALIKPNSIGGAKNYSLYAPSNITDSFRSPLAIKMPLGKLPIVSPITNVFYLFDYSTFSSYCGGIRGNYLCDGLLYTGTASSGSSSSLTDQSKSFTENELVGKYIIVSKSNGSSVKDSISKITSNTSTTINFYQFETSVAAGDTYYICTTPYKVVDNYWLMKHNFDSISVSS